MAGWNMCVIAENKLGSVTRLFSIASIGCRFVAAFAMLALGASTACGHVVGNDRINVDYQIDDEAVVCTMTIPPRILEVVLQKGIAPSNLDSAARLAVLEEFVEVFQKKNPVTIDGVVVLPVIRTGTFGPLSEPEEPDTTLPPEVEEIADTLLDGSFYVVLTYSAKSPPKRVSLVWTMMEAIKTVGSAFPGQEERPLIVSLENGTGDAIEMDYIIFSPEEPEFVWHRPGEHDALPSLVLTPKAMDTLTLPVVSIGIGAIIMLSLPMLSLRKFRSRSILVVLGVSVVVAGAGWWYRPVEIENPWAHRELPSKAEAEAIFQTLHANIYRAFDYHDEEAIYDTLAQSVDGALLDWIYNEVYHGLVLREDGGAVCRVKSVKILENEFIPLDGQADKEPAFQIRCRWQVVGFVAHWGHVHCRTNEYEAYFTVAERDNTWKIVHAEVLRQERVTTFGACDMQPRYASSDKLQQGDRL